MSQEIKNQVNQMKTSEIITAMLSQESQDFDSSHVEALSKLIDENHDIDDFINLDKNDEDEFEDERQQIIDALECFGDDDFNLDFDGNEYRIISEPAIWEIYVNEIQQIVEDCYELNLDKIPDFIAVSIDWEQTAQNAFADGYGHTFNSYDGSELETSDYYIFRTN